MRPTCAPQFPISGSSVGPADRANATVPLQNLLAKIARVAAEAPFVHAPIRTECEASCGDFQAAPTAERPAIVSLRQSGAIGGAARHSPGSTRKRHNILRIKCLTRFRYSNFKLVTLMESPWTSPVTLTVKLSFFFEALIAARAFASPAASSFRYLPSAVYTP